MEFSIKRDVLLKSLGFIQGIVEKKNTLPILSNVLIQIKANKLILMATDLEIFFCSRGKYLLSYWLFLKDLKN